MSDRPDSVIDDPAARSMIVGSVSFEGARSLAEGIAWLLSSPDLRDGDDTVGVELRIRDTPNAGVAELVLFVAEGGEKGAESAFAIILSPTSRQGR